MDREKNERGVEYMSTMKPIQATPELSGEDAEKLIRDVNRKPTKEALEWKKLLQRCLKELKE
ncbi:MAG: hypothetical protein IJ455_01840 [Agathobacter sp.]|nr:hypothetical protein [Agathobacter sp.]